VIAAAALGGVSHAMAALAIGATALLLAFVSLSRPAARLARWPLASALLGGGWIALLAGTLLGPGGFGLLHRESLIELRPLTQLGLAWIGLLVGLQMKRSLLALVPTTLWRWIAFDALISFITVAAWTFLVLRWAAPNATLRMVWPIASLAGAASIGWSGELRSLRGLDARAVRVASLVQAGAGLGSVLAIVSSDLISFSPEGSRALMATLLVAAAAGFSLRAVLGSQVGSDGRLTLALLATLSLVAGAAAAMDATPLPGAFLLGIIVTNTQGGSMRRMERLVSESEPAVAAIFFLLAGVLLEGANAWWPWVVAGGVLLVRLVAKPMIAGMALRHAWKEPGAARLRSAVVRQAPIAIALGVAALQSHDGSVERGILLALTAVGLASGVLPLLWRSRA
jgi:hypothetical protein